MEVKTGVGIFFTFTPRQSICYGQVFVPHLAMGAKAPVRGVPGEWRAHRTESGSGGGVDGFLYRLVDVEDDRLAAVVPSSFLADSFVADRNDAANAGRTVVNQPAPQLEHAHFAARLSAPSTGGCRPSISIIDFSAGIKIFAHST
jgi:hypothetical protein